MFVGTSSTNDVRSSPSGPLDILRTCGEPVAMGQVAMATGHDGWQTARTGGAGSPMGGRPSGPQAEDGRRVRKGNSVPREEKRVSDASGSASKGVTGVKCTFCCCKIYYP